MHAPILASATDSWMDVVVGTTRSKATLSHNYVYWYYKAFGTRAEPWQKSTQESDTFLGGIESHELPL